MSKKIYSISTELLSAVEVYKLVLSRKLRSFPAGFWSEVDGKDNAGDVTRYLIEEILKWTEDDVKNKFIQKVLVDHKLSGMMMLFNNSSFHVLDNAYPGKYLPWELTMAPKGFWNDENCRRATKWLVEEMLNIDLKDITKKIEGKDFNNNGLNGMMHARFNNCPYKAIDFTYPGRFREWEVTKTPRGFWNRENGIDAIRWLFEEKLKLPEQEIPVNATAATFKAYGLKGMLSTCFGGRPFMALEAAYPGRYKETDMSCVPNGYWTKKRTIEAIRELFDVRLKWTHDDIAMNLKSDTLLENGLYNAMKIHYNYRTLDAVNEAYPGEFKEWEFRNFKRIEWTKEKAVDAVRWMTEEKLKWSEQEVKKIRSMTFIENDLNGAIDFFGYCAGAAVMEAYPGKYKMWEFAQVPKGFWNIEAAVKATKWLVEDRLHLSHEDIIKGKLTKRKFIENHLSGMLDKCYNGSSIKAAATAYPELFPGSEAVFEMPQKESKSKRRKERKCQPDAGIPSAAEVYKLVLSGEMESFPRNYWSESESKERAKEIIRYLFEEILNWSDEDVRTNFNYEIVNKYKLRGMKQTCFGGSLFDLLKNAYPGKFMPWEMVRKPNDFWNDESCKLAVRWLVEKVLDIDIDDPKKQIDTNDFMENGIKYVLKKFHNSPYQAVNFAYPGKFKEWEITKTVKGFWNRENGIEATKWLVEKKLQIRPDDIDVDVITNDVFRERNLGGMLRACFSRNSRNALEAAYPEVLNKYE